MSEDNKKRKKTGKITYGNTDSPWHSSFSRRAVLYRQFIIPKRLAWLFPWMESAVFAGLFPGGVLDSFPVASDWGRRKMALFGSSVLAAILAVVCIALVLA